MTIEIQERIEGKRGCGYRRAGGIYLVGPPTRKSCCRLPWPLTVCPTCGAGVHVSRGWTWVEPRELFKEGQNLPNTCQTTIDLAIACVPWNEAAVAASVCPLADPQVMGRAGLLWIGEKFYKTPDEFLQEANTMGISRRISAVPKGFEPGKTWVLLAHRKGVLKRDPEPEDYDMDKGGKLNPGMWNPAIFSVFRPLRIEYVTTGDETEEDLEQLAKRGLTPVVVRNRVACE